MKFTLSLFLLMSFSLMAAGRNEAYQVICQKLSFESDRTKCLNQIKPYQYFDDRGLNLCASFSFDSEKLTCLSLISDKVYEDYEMSACINATFNSDKLKCLKENGTTYRKTCLPRNEVEMQLKSSLDDLRARNYGSVEKRLMYLYAKFSDQCE